MEILVVDNASQDESVKIVKAVTPQATLLRQEQNLGFAGGANAGIRVSKGDWVAILNNDTELAGDWLSECLNAIQRYPDAAFLACKVLDYRNHEYIYSAGDCFLRAGIGYCRGRGLTDRPEYHRECEIFSASGCAALYRKAVLEKNSAYDDSFFAYFEDVDLGLRLQAADCRGYYVPQAKVYHHGAATSGGEFSSLSVRLRTRNSLLMLIKSMPACILWRCLPMIFIAQLSWFFRVAVHIKLGSYLRGLGSFLFLAPQMLKKRAQMRTHWHQSIPKLWEKIMQSESMAQKDFTLSPLNTNSLFLSWYFRLFGKGIWNRE